MHGAWVHKHGLSFQYPALIIYTSSRTMFAQLASDWAHWKCIRPEFLTPRYPWRQNGRPGPGNPSVQDGA